ncbi:pyridoxal phosphate-dependent aminotransferase [Lujinxingia litoralis]|uniref:Pyridoxal phosphate-dependent aminotransferase n=1 Tax=Lujinxingia litoralis TaxID=2211119 RepID=A0A328C8X0_9DELT|nr:DegT/DnrJ/EryC1/StrS family aminotransferase [Lujinxingia litoralis]RAL21826.1 pyridoxal phosphate-dependent aminotransferase [Lujinxingia litoralis]
MTAPNKTRIYLSPPDIGDLERRYVQEAFDTNWIAPLGPNVDGFEAELAARVGVGHAAALISGTAALHLALRLCGVGPGDEVVVSSLTFVASAAPVVQLGARPIFIDAERASWNLDPALVAEFLETRAQEGRLPRALIVVHLYGQSADLDPLVEICARYGVALIEDAAEALGATYKGRAPGSLGKAGIFSFNGNKIITSSGGGMLVSDDADFIAHARKLATQARDPAPHYEHTELGYNYRMSNVVAGIGRGQLASLDQKVQARRANFAHYQEALGALPGLTFQPEAPWGMHSRWLTCLTIDPQTFGNDREAIRLALEAENIEARPVWKPMHLQPVFAEAEMVGGAVSEDLFERGLCLPSGSSLSAADRERIIAIVGDCARQG